MSINDFKIKIGSFDVKIHINKNEVRRREKIRKNFEQDKRIKEIREQHNKHKDHMLL